MTASDQSRSSTGQQGNAAPSTLFPTLPVALGNYELTQLLGRRAGSESYIAHQLHAERRVVLEVQRPTEDADGYDAVFLALARARGATKLPHTAPVLESTISPEGYAYICQTLPEGHALSALAAQGKTLTGPQACALIAAAAELYTAAAETGLAAEGLTSDRIFMDRQGGFHFLSPVLAGAPAEGDTSRQLSALAEVMRTVHPVNVPGQGRISTLLLWMQEGYEGEALDWLAAANTAELIAEQLRPETILHVSQPQRYDRGRDRRADKRRRRQLRRTALLISSAVCTVIAMGVSGLLQAPESVLPIPALREGWVHARVGDKTYCVAERPVSIADYHRYLLAYAELDAGRRGSLAQNVPPTETDPIPTDWESQLAAADKQVPVANVSYWQALMYTRFHRAALPSAPLLAAARAEAGHPGIEEWTQDESPATPPYEAARIVLPAEAAASPVPEHNPAARSPQRGFRLCR